jgi:hypothetical protein
MWLTGHAPDAIIALSAIQLYSMPVTQNMNIGNEKRRGRPIYITSESATISLVPEIAAHLRKVGIGRRRGVVLRTFRPFALYVINTEGVHPLNFRDTRAWFKGLMLAIGLLAPLPLRLMIRKSRLNNG